MNLSKNNKMKTCKIHRLVAEAFIPNIYNKSTVNHIDGNPLNNRVDNLEWNTLPENVLHHYRIKKEKIINLENCYGAGI